MASIRLALAVIAASLFTSMAVWGQTIFFVEGFEDAAFTSRGWYDNDRIEVTTAEHFGGASSGLFHFPQGARTSTSGGAIRRKFAASDEVYLSYRVKYSANWTGSNKPYHPHEFHFVTNLEHDYIGPAYTHLTLYIEQNEGRPLLAMQDAANIDETRVGQDLTGVTEQRSVAGCNGDSDGYGSGDCYQSGSVHNNGKQWKAPGVFFTDTAGPYDKNDWHHIEAYFKLNSIVAGKGVADGIVRYWYDGAALIDHDDVMLRTGQHPDMKFNQFLIAPYIGDGSPVDQTMWVDDLLLASSRPASAVGAPSRLSSSSVAGGLTASPNPATGDISLRFTLPARSPARLELCDLLGRTLIARRYELEAGEQSIPLETASLIPGTYLCRIATGLGVIGTRVRVGR